MSTLYKTELEIRVADGDRRPLENFVICIAGSEPQAPGGGRFRISGLPSGSVRIYIEAQGRARADLTVEVAGRKQSVDVVLGEPGLPTFKRCGVPVPFRSPDDKLGFITRGQEGVTVLDHFVQL